MPEKSALSLFEIPPYLVMPALRACRLFNTQLDKLFYDTPTLEKELKARGKSINTLSASSGADDVDLGGIANPEGSLLLINPAREPYIRSFHDVQDFLACPDADVQTVTIATITGVGSSALGSAALAWDIASALGQPVLAIVPGYGVADVVLQGMGGWFGFGLYDFLNIKPAVQMALASVAPQTAKLGRHLSSTTPDAPELPNGGPVFRTGSGSSDVLHAVLQQRALTCVIGHSKGALAIGNALRSLPPEDTEDLKVVTLGCTIAETTGNAVYYQYLGLFDALGQMNSWGRRPSEWITTDHSTNITLPFSMDAEELVLR